MPGWAIALIFAIPVTIMAVLFTRAARLRARQSKARRSPLARKVPGVPIGSSAAIADGGQVPWENLLDALALAPEDHGPKDGMPHDEGWMGTMLGLKSRMHSGTGPDEPHVFWGEHRGRQVLIRLGPDEKAQGGELMSNRRLLSIVLVRADLPPFELRGEDGEIVPADGTDLPGAVAATIVSLAPSPDVWRRLRIAAGPEGIVAVRPLIDDFLSGWVYDLWLLERLADDAGAPPLPRKRIGPAWKIPYGMGRA